MTNSIVVVRKAYNLPKRNHLQFFLFQFGGEFPTTEIDLFMVRFNSVFSELSHTAAALSLILQHSIKRGI